MIQIIYAYKNDGDPKREILNETFWVISKK